MKRHWNQRVKVKSKTSDITTHVLGLFLEEAIKRFFGFNDVDAYSFTERVIMAVITGFLSFIAKILQLVVRVCVFKEKIDREEIIVELRIAGLVGLGLGGLSPGFGGPANTFIATNVKKIALTIYEWMGELSGVY